LVVFSLPSYFFAETLKRLELEEMELRFEEEVRMSVVNEI
jgi:hypothetical protein